jgi:peptide/nickel transport system ATP-binding protein
MTNAIFEVENLSTHFFIGDKPVKAVDGVSFALTPGKVIGLVGESGSGKSATGYSIMGLIDPPGRVVSGRILYKGTDLVGLPEERLRQIRGAKIAMIFQDPMMTLNPVLSIETQMVESVLAHERMSREDARKRARDTLGLMGIPSPDERLKAFPHQFSGGMRQRVVIAIAMLHRPDVIIADEATTALDVTIQGQILSEVQKLCADNRTALIWITHDLSVVAGLADEVCVMYAGRIVEQGAVDAILDAPVHPYTFGLIGSVPSRNKRGSPLRQIPGTTPSLTNLPKGCAFRSRCFRADEACLNEPALEPALPGRLARCFHPLLEAVPA